MLELMEPRCILRDIRIIFGDGFFNDEFLDKLGLHRPITSSDTEVIDLIWDCYHLSSDIWPKMFGLNIYALIRQHLEGMLYAYNYNDFKKHYWNCVKILERDPSNLEKVNDIYSHPERFAKHYVVDIIGNAGMLGSQISESNHNMVRSHCGSGSNQDLIAQVMTLMEKKR